jgi:class 3 adenylate cyclase/pimeloyl-ACP methyl ester carboxylesterase
MGSEAPRRKPTHRTLAPPRISFAVREGAHLAYQVAGEGPLTIVYVAGSAATSQAWDDPVVARGFRRLASFSRLVTYDQRGTGYSDRFDPSVSPTFDDLVADLEAVIEAAEADDPVLFGTHNGGAVAAVYATTHAVRQLVLCNTWARLEEADDFSIGFSDQVLDRLEERYRTEWGQGRLFNQFSPRRQGEEAPGRAELASTSQNQLMTIFRLNRKYDIRSVLPSITTPTLVLHLEDNLSVPPAHGRYIAAAIPGARLVLVPGTDQAFLRNYATPVIDEVELFVTGNLTVFRDRVHTAIVFTDIVDSTPLAAAMGDEKWSALIDAHNERVRSRVAEHGGETLKSTGDGFLAAFDEPTAAIRCAVGAMDAVRDLGLELRAGVHVGDVSPMGNRDLSGIAVHFAQRLCTLAEGGQVLVSEAVRDACTGSDVRFAERGKAALKGLPGQWAVFEACV